MQFYKVHPSPTESARMLPDYALQKVNLREGWQILSDIGHIHGVTWPHQNKLYSNSHALTLHLCSSPHMLTSFVADYIACLNEYQMRFRKTTVWHEYFLYFNEVLNELTERLPANPYEATVRYLLTHKIKHLTNEEVKRLTQEEKQI